MAYPLVSIAVEKLNNILQDEVALLVGVTDEIKKLSRTFTLIQAVLKDAETRRVKDEAVKIWFENVKDVAYDVDDILDEWMTEAPRSQAPDEGDGSSFIKKKVQSFLSPVTRFNHVVLRHKIGNRVKQVRGRLDDIAKDMSQLGLRVDSGESERVDSEVRRGEIRERETSSLLDRPSVVGREHEKNEVLDLLLQEVTEVPLVISIVGMGGLGKTTLVQLVYNDEDVKGHFDMRMWVCVSEDFDVKRITKSIIESATGTSCESLDLDPLQDHLRGMLQAKRFLLVLDDIWSKDSEMWDKLKIPFQAGLPGSRIIVTTRMEDVAGMMGSTHIHKLAVLSDDDCWLLFRSKALEHRNEEERSELEDIGREIIKKCGGVPLAAKTIGSVMRSRRTRSQWELVLGSNMWNSGDVFEGILPALLLSYYHLPPALKQCFAYCSIFPKDWKIEKDMLVKLWVAQSFICSNGSGDVEEISKLYFDDLLRRSLLQDAEMDFDGSIFFRCKMHDLVHDLAQYVAGSDCSMVEIRKQASSNLKNVQHLFLVDNDEAGDEADKVASISATLYKAHKLRTLLLQDSRISKVPETLFHHLRCLRALDLRLSDIKKLPQTVGRLKHLRHLDLSSTGIKKLPQTVGQLKQLRHLDLSDTDIEELPAVLSNCINLQTLRLNSCLELKKLPRGMGKMISLRHLEFKNCHNLMYLPQGIGRLTGLRTLTEFIVGGDDRECKCGELKHLNHLQGSLPITGLQNVRSRDEAREAELYKKQHLHELSLVYKYRGEEPLDDEVKRMEDVLESLQPHTNLKELKIMYYKGSKLPKWIGDPTFSNLVRVNLSHCFKCKQLPGLGKLLSLKYLRIVGMKKVRKVGGEFSGDGNNDGSRCGGVSFPKLKTLSFYKMPNWEEWELRGGGGEVMPSLLKLKIHNCPKMKVLHCNLLSLLGTLILERINNLSGEPLPVLPNLKNLKIVRIDELTSLPVGWLGQLKALQTLQIRECPQLRSLPEELGQLKAVQTLQIRECPQLGSLPEELGQLKALQTLRIKNCPQLGSLPEELGQLKALQTLRIKNCPQLGSLPEELGQLEALQNLQIRECPQLVSLPEELGQVKALQTLQIKSCLQLGSLPKELGQLKVLRTLEIHDCPQLGSLPEELGQLQALQTLLIRKCPQLGSLPEELGQLKALQTLRIKNCPQLGSLPEELGQFKALQTLEVHDCPQLGSLPEELGQLKSPPNS